MKQTYIKYKIGILVALLLFLTKNANAQTDLEKALETPSTMNQKVEATFKAGKIINSHTNETLYKRELNFKVDHRFGDIAGANGGLKKFFGLDQSADVRIGFEYGLTDKLTLGLSRSKGVTSVQQLYEGSVKYRLVQQTLDNSFPVALTIFASNTVAGVEANLDDPTSATSYRNFAERMNYVVQLIVARKFSPNFSFTAIPSYVRRNLTVFNDQNDMYALGLGARIKFSKRMALVVDYFLAFRNQGQQAYLEQKYSTKYTNPLGVGLEIETGGHVFNLNFTNATGLQEMQFITETTSSWLKGQYRWGFSIARRFNL